MEPSISLENSHYFRNEIIRWGRENFADYPWRGLNNPWHSLVAEIMLQRTNAGQVVPSFLEFVQKYPDPESYLADNNPRVFSRLGLPQREESLRQLAQQLVNSQIPIEKEHLLSLPAIGDYIAAAFRSLHMGEKDYIIDSNVVRLYGRFFGFETHAETRRKKWFIRLADELTPAIEHQAYNYGLLDFTREICRPRPRCHICPLSEKCHYYNLIQGREENR